MNVHVQGVAKNRPIYFFFLVNNAAKLIKICIKHVSRIASLKSYFGYLYTKYLKIAIKILKKWKNGFVRFSIFFSYDLNHMS